MKKIIAIILTVTLVVTSMPADVFALRPIAYRSSVEETDDSEDSLTREEKIARARALMQSLRPEFHGKKKLTTREFENHVRRMAEEQGVTYIRITEGPISFMKTNTRTFWLRVSQRDLLAILIQFCFVVGLSARPKYIYEYDENRLLKLEIRMPGKTSFIFPLNNVLLIKLLFSSLPRHWLVLDFLFILYGWAFSYSVIGGYIVPDRCLSHELRHAYIDLLLNGLAQKNLISGGEKTSSLHRSVEFRYTMLTIKELERIEERIIDTLFAKEEQVPSKPRPLILRRLLRMPTRRSVNLPPLPMAKPVDTGFSKDIFTLAQAA